MGKRSKAKKMTDHKATRHFYKAIATALDDYRIHFTQSRFESALVNGQPYAVMYFDFGRGDVPYGVPLEHIRDSFGINAKWEDLVDFHAIKFFKAVHAAYTRMVTEPDYYDKRVVMGA